MKIAILLALILLPTGLAFAVPPDTSLYPGAPPRVYYAPSPEPAPAPWLKMMPTYAAPAPVNNYNPSQYRENYINNLPTQHACYWAGHTQVCN